MLITIVLLSVNCTVRKANHITIISIIGDSAYKSTVGDYDTLKRNLIKNNVYFQIAN